MNVKSVRICYDLFAVDIVCNFLLYFFPCHLDSQFNIRMFSCIAFVAVNMYLLLMLSVFRQEKLEKAAVNNFCIRDIVQPSMTCFCFIWNASMVASVVPGTSSMFALFLFLTSLTFCSQRSVCSC